MTCLSRLILTALAGMHEAKRQPERAALLREASVLQPHGAANVIQYSLRSFTQPVREVGETLGTWRCGSLTSGDFHRLTLSVTGEHVGYFPEGVRARIAKATEIHLVIKRGFGGDLSEVVEAVAVLAQSGKLLSAHVEEFAMSASALMFALCPCPRVMRQIGRAHV